MLKRKHLVLTGLILIIGLQLVGLSHGQWFEPFRSSGVINTGSLEVLFENLTTNDWLLYGDGTQRYERTDPLNASMFEGISCQATLSSGMISAEFNEDSEWKAISEELGIFIEGAMPGYGCLISFDIRSTGTVPVGVKFTTTEPNPFVTFTCDGVEAASQTFQLSKDQMMSCQLEVQAPLNGDDLAELAEYPLGYIVQAAPLE